MELKDLVGMHELSGVDRLSDVEVPDGYGGTDIAEVLRFTLDGVTYAASENSDDGYRSMMRDLSVSTEPTANQFPAVQVFATIRDRWGYSDTSEILELLTMEGKRVLAVGTANIDDYYPYFVAEFDAEALGKVVE